MIGEGAMERLEEAKISKVNLVKFGVAAELLALIRENIDDRAVIAGGFVRDMLYGRDPKDADVWLYNEISKKSIQNLAHNDVVIKRNIRLENSVAMYRIITVEYKGVVFDVIQLKDPNTLAHARFDFGINQAWTDGEEVYTTQAFENDQDNKTLTYLDTQENLNRFDRLRKERIPKFTAMFPDHRLVGLVVAEDGLYYPATHPNKAALDAGRVGEERLVSTDDNGEESERTPEGWERTQRAERFRATIEVVRDYLGRGFFPDRWRPVVDQIQRLPATRQTRVVFRDGHTVIVSDDMVQNTDLFRAPRPIQPPVPESFTMSWEQAGERARATRAIGEFTTTTTTVHHTLVTVSRKPFASASITSFNIG